MRRYLDLTKPRLTLMALATTLLGFFMASYTPAGTGQKLEPLQTTLLLCTLLASALIGGGVNALNQYLERFIDAKMKRTENRPIPSGLIQPDHALFFGLVLSVSGMALLIAFTNRLTVLLGAITIISYVFFYTPLKAKTSLNTLVGAVPGAIPCIMGWTACRSSLPLEAWSLFFILFFWQLPHFFAIAWVYREDYRKGGLRMLTHSDMDGLSTGKKVILTSLILFPFTLYPVWLGLGGAIYLSVAAVAGVFFNVAAIRLYRSRMSDSKNFVALSIYYLMILIFSMIVDKII